MIVFGANPIVFTAPRALAGVATVLPVAPVLTTLPSGYTITGLQYRIVALADPARGGKPSKYIIGDWEADRSFRVVTNPVAPNAVVTISGSTQVRLPIGTGKIEHLRVRGEVLTVPREVIDDVEFKVTRFVPGPAPTPVTWNASGPTEGPLNVGVHTLFMDSGVMWAPKNAGDIILVTSEYTVTVEAPADGKEYKGTIEA